MEQINKLILQQSSTLGQINYLTNLKEKLNPEECKVIELKYSGKTFSLMTEDERWFSAKTLLLKIHSITGWSIPVNEMMEILIDQFQKKLTEGYKNVTIAEVEYAFRNKGTDIKDWGKAMSLSLFDEVMIPYLESRFEVSKTEESISHRKVLQIKSDGTMSDEDWDEWIPDIMNYPIEKIPTDCFSYLERSGKLGLSNQEKHEYIEKAVGWITTHIDSLQIDTEEFFRQKKLGEFSGKLIGTVKSTAKRLAVYDYFKNLSQ